MQMVCFLRNLIAICLIYTYATTALADTNKLYLAATQSESKVAVPHTVLGQANAAIEAGKLSPSELNSLLQVMFLEYSPAFMRANIQHLENAGDQEYLLSELDKARKEVVSIRWKPVYEIYKHSLAIKNKHLQSAWHWAWQKYPSWNGHMQYRLDIVSNNVKRETLEFEYEQIFREAQIGLRPAMLLLADHYERGFNLRKSIFKSVFWFRMAQWEGADTQEKIKELGLLLSKNENRQIEHMIKTNQYPDVMQTPQQGWALRGGPNKRWTPPYLRSRD